MNTIRIYGFTRDYGSYAQVTRGFQEGLIDSGFVPGEELDLVSLEDEQSFDEDPSGLPLADVAILTGPPMAAGKLTHGVKHERRLVMVAPNSDKLPERTMHTVNQHATELLSPSAWGARVLERYTDKPVRVVPHGVSAGFQTRPHSLGALKEQLDSFRILHLSSTDGQRKGTEELCRGFASARKSGVLPKHAQLILLLTPSARGQILDVLSELDVSDRIVIFGRLGLEGGSPEQISELFASVHVVCQPSRGEGFGMVPLEALACGVPVVATDCTGHSEWFTSELAGAVRIPTGELAPIDDMPGALAPSLSPEHIAEALGTAYDFWQELKHQAMAAAPGISRTWSWKRRLHDFASEIGVVVS